jgi:hypothetical protein
MSVQVLHFSHVGAVVHQLANYFADSPEIKFRTDVAVRHSVWEDHTRGALKRIPMDHLISRRGARIALKSSLYRLGRILLSLSIASDAVDSRGKHIKRQPVVQIEAHLSHLVARCTSSIDVEVGCS